MGYRIFVIDAGGYPGASNIIANAQLHFFYDDKFAFAGTEG